MAAIPSADLPETEKQELMVNYAALILMDDHQEVTEASLLKILKAANCEVEPYLPTLFARALKGRDLSSLLSVSAGPATGGAVESGAGEGAAAAKEPEPEPEEEEEEEDMGFSLFG